MPKDNQLEAKILKLLAYCQANDWAGYDPYDAVNSQAFAALPFLNSRLPRLFLNQALKRSPVNIRRFLRIPKTQNPKAIALFLSAFLKLSRIGVVKTGDLVNAMILLISEITYATRIFLVRLCYAVPYVPAHERKEIPWS